MIESRINMWSIYKVSIAMTHNISAYLFGGVPVLGRLINTLLANEILPEGHLMF